jgi:hypothetical protein
VEAGNGLRDGAWLVLLRPARHGITEGIRERKSEAAAAEGGDGAGGAIGWTKADMAGAKAATGAKLQVDLRLEGLFFFKKKGRTSGGRQGLDEATSQHVEAEHRPPYQRPQMTSFALAHYQSLKILCELYPRCSTTH